MDFRNRIIKFMRGRYGVDELYKFLLCLYIVVFILNIFLNSILLDILGLVIVLFTFYRFFSKNVHRRGKENKAYIKIKKEFIKPFSNIKRKFLDKDHIYKKCSNCKITLKLPLPYKRGINHATCPKCGKRLTLFVMKKQKVEIIKNNK